MSYTPNQIPLHKRMLRAGGATFLLAYGIVSLRMDDFVIPGKRGAIHLHGLPGWILFAALIVAAAAMVSAIIDHYDRRNNESLYRNIEEWGAKAGAALFALAIGLNIAGVRYPAESTFTKTSIGAALVLTPLFYFLLTRKTISGQADTAANADTVHAPHAAYTPVRWRTVAGMLLVIVGGLATLLGLPSAIRLPLSLYGALVSTAVGLTIFGVYLLRVRNGTTDLDAPTGPSNTHPIVAPPPTQRKPLLWFVAGAIVCTAVILLIRRPADTWSPGDEQALASAPAFSQSVSDFRAGTSFAEIRAKLGNEGFRPRCYDSLRREDKLNADDVAICWAYARRTFGIESRMLAFFFGPNGLQSVRAEFPGAQWPQVRRWFNALSPASPVRKNGVDAWGDPVFVRDIPGAMVITGEPGRDAPVIVLWRANRYDDATRAQRSPTISASLHGPE